MEILKKAQEAAQEILKEIETYLWKKI